MKDIEKLIEIASFINAADILPELHLLKQKINFDNPEIVVPIVGTFSTGKSSLINALMDNPVLEVGQDPTTAAIFEIRFNQDSFSATISKATGETFRSDSDNCILNQNFDGSEVIKISDTSNRVPKSLVLVDTPGLASENERHRDALMNYISKADAIILAINVVQPEISQLLDEFAKSINIGERPVFIVLTACDRKVPSAIANIKNNLKTNILDIPAENIVTTSAVDGDLDDFYSMLFRIQERKKEIVTSAARSRLHDISLTLIKLIEELKYSSQDNSSSDEVLGKLERRLEDYNRNIDELLDKSIDIISKKSDECKKRFLNSIHSQLRSIVKNGGNYNKRIEDAVVSHACTSLSSYIDTVKGEIIDTATEFNRIGKEIPLETLKMLDFASVAFNESTFLHNLTLDTLGHENDKTIEYATKAVAVIALATLVVCTAGSVAPAASAAASAEGTATAAGGVATAAKTGLSVATIASGADTLTDIMSINRSTKSMKVAKQSQEDMAKLCTQLREQKSRLKVATQGAEDVYKKSKDYMPTLEKEDVAIGQKMGLDRGLVGSMVFKINEVSAEKERLSIIESYFSQELTFKIMDAMEDIEVQTLYILKSSLLNEAEESIRATRERVEELKRIRNEGQVNFQAYLSKLDGYLTYLNQN